MSSVQKTRLKISDRAAKEIKQIIQENNISPEYALRIGVKASGCSGLKYILVFDVAKENDAIFELNGIKVIIDQKSLSYLKETELDFIDSPTGHGFVFHSPNLVRSCGCGDSSSA